jgi:hypothetical protein
MSNAQKKAAKLSTLTNTIDEKHTEMLNHYYKLEKETIPNMEDELRSLKHKLAHTPDTKVDIQTELRDKIRQLRAQIHDVKTQRKNYLLDNSKYIFQYFEDKKKISSGDNSQNRNTVNQFFRIKSTSSDTTTQSDRYNQSKIFYQKYWKNVSNEVVNLQDLQIQSDICEFCHMGELIPQDEEGILICNNSKCGNFITHIVDNSKPSNKEPPNEVSYTAYIRLNHFKEILSQFQAKETTQIPDSVIEQIKNRIKKERITDFSTINYDKMRDILRKLGLNKYFEHIQYINSIFGIKPPIMSEELHETLCVLFIEIQKPWAVHCPADRSNFFNYTYTLYQLCVLLDQTQYLPYIPMMKDREKQLDQDMTWKKVCNDLDWEFFPTV